MATTVTSDRVISENERSFGDTLNKLQKALGGNSGVYGRVRWLQSQAAALNDADGAFWGDDGAYPVNAPESPTDDDLAIAAKNAELKARWDRFWAAITTTGIVDGLDTVADGLEAFDDATGLLGIQ